MYSFGVVNLRLSKTESVCVVLMYKDSTETRPIKAIVQPKINVLSSFTHPRADSNLYDFLSFSKKL